MYFSHLLEYDFALTTGKHTQMTKENRKGMKDLKATFHLTISMLGQLATGKIQRNNYHHGSCGPSLTGKTSSVFLIFTQGRIGMSKIVE